MSLSHKSDVSLLFKYFRCLLVFPKRLMVHAHFKNVHTEAYSLDPIFTINLEGRQSDPESKCVLKTHNTEYSNTDKPSVLGRELPQNAQTISNRHPTINSYVPYQMPSGIPAFWTGHQQQTDNSTATIQSMKWEQSNITASTLPNRPADRLTLPGNNPVVTG